MWYCHQFRQMIDICERAQLSTVVGNLKHNNTDLYNEGKKLLCWCLWSGKNYRGISSKDLPSLSQNISKFNTFKSTILRAISFPLALT